MDELKREIDREGVLKVFEWKSSQQNTQTD